MTPEQIIELRSYINTDPTLVSFANDGRDDDAANAINAITTVVFEKSRMIGERGIMSALGIIDGSIFMAALDDFSMATLAPDHPLLAYQPGIKRAVKWLYGDGLDLGDPLTRQMLDALAAASVITSASSLAIQAVAKQTISYPVNVGWGMLSANEIARAVRDDFGNSLLGV